MEELKEVALANVSGGCRYCAELNPPSALDAYRGLSQGIDTQTHLSFDLFEMVVS